MEHSPLIHINVDLESGPGRRRVIGQRYCRSNGQKIAAFVSNVARAEIPHPVMIAFLARAAREVRMDNFIHAANIALYRKLIAESELDPSRDETRHTMLLALLADEIAREKKPPDSQTLAELHSTVLMIAALTAGA